MSQEHKTRMETLLAQGLAEFGASTSAQDLEEARAKVFGRKGPLTELSRSLKELSDEDRREVGAMLNQVRTQLEQAHDERLETIRSEELAARLEADRVDVTLPGRAGRRGHPHPIAQTMERIVDVFVAMGYRVAEGPEVEDDWHNFQALNIPADHPARSMQDTLYLGGLDLLLRTHTSPVQIRSMRKQGEEGIEVQDRPPLYVVAPGRVYRRDPFDAYHSPCFHQVEGLAVDRDISFADLKGTLAEFARHVLGEGQRVRLRPSYFPFVEPGAEVDVLCVHCGGDGCASCGRTGWLEIMGAGMVHPEVLRAGGYDPDHVSGFAFGMGVERIAMMVHRVPDIRTFWDNDVRFLRAFHG